MNKQINAFNWQEFTDEEHARKGDPFKAIKRNAAISANVTATVHKLRKVNPGHGTLQGISEKNPSFYAPSMMGNGGFKKGNTFGKGGARPNAGKKLPNIDERRAFALYADGMTKKHIANLFGVPYKSMLTIFRKAGKYVKQST
jgi:hypothetical protein